MIIDLVVGARPNFVKAAAIIHAAKNYPNVKINLIHTGQHTDAMSDPFFRELELPAPITPAVDREIFRYSYVERFASMLAFCSNAFQSTRPDYVVVVGDTDSTLAGALAAKKMGIPLIHVEAGLRCGDRKMQEEINRVLVDSVSDICYTTSIEARDSLIAEGSRSHIQFVGNVMVDTLYRFLPKALETWPQEKRPDGQVGKYAIMTLHRAENVDNPEVFDRILSTAREISKKRFIYFITHPRIGDRSVQGHLKDDGNYSLLKVQPTGYFRFISLLSRAEFVMTDSGGVQEETTALGVPCFTLRDVTERPETESMGSNLVVGTNKESILWAVQNMPLRVKGVPPLWDGHAADRILADLVGGIPN